MTTPAEITNAEQAAEARRRLDEMNTRIVELREEREDVSRQIAAALARSGPEAEAALSGLEVRRSEIAMELGDLDQNAHLLAMVLDRWTFTEKEQRANALSDEIDQLLAESREIERQYADAIVQAVKLGKQMQDNYQTFQRKRSMLGKLGRILTPVTPPRQPEGLRLTDKPLREHPEITMRRWLGEDVPYPAPPRTPKRVPKETLGQGGETLMQRLTVITDRFGRPKQIVAGN